MSILSRNVLMAVLLSIIVLILGCCFFPTLVMFSFSACFFFLKRLDQSVERATPGEDVPGCIPAVAARSLLVGSVSV